MVAQDGLWNGTERLRVIVTGHNGFIGSRVVRRFQESQHEVHGYGRKEGGITDFQAVKNFFGRIGPDVIIHCAANGDIGDCQKNPDEAYRVNVLGTRNVSAAARLTGAWMIHLSSDQVYDPHTGTPLPETVDPDPQNFYGKTKVWGEREVASICPEHFILRISWHYDWIAPGMPGTRGGILEVLANTLKRGDIIQGGLRNCGHVTYVEDLVDAIEHMAAGTLPFGTYNVSSDHDLNDAERARAILVAGGVSEDRALDLVEGIDGRHPPYAMRTVPYNLRRLGYAFPTFEQGLARCMERYGPIFRDLVAELDER